MKLPVIAFQLWANDCISHDIHMYLVGDLSVVRLGQMRILKQYELLNRRYDVCSEM